MANYATKQNVYEIITDKIITALENDIIPWQKPWKGGVASMPMNAVSKRPYSGINSFLLGMQGYADNRWVTFKQAIALKGSVRKGEHGTMIIFWSIVDKRDGPKDDDKKRIAILRYYTVFNVEQCDGLTLAPIELTETNEFVPDDYAEMLVSRMPNPPKIEHSIGGDRAYYRPTADTITLPAQEQFTSSQEYYATLFHELSHSTGHESRLNRHGYETGVAPFGSETYSKEELVAEFGSAFLCQLAGIDNTLPNATSYIKGWLSVLRNDPKMLINAASHGQKAATYIIGDLVSEGEGEQDA